MDADGASSSSALAEQPGVSDFLSTRHGVQLHGRILDSGEGPLVLPPGRFSRPSYEMWSRERLSELVRQCVAVGDLVVIDAPAVLDSDEAQIVCSVVDTTLVVVEEYRTKTDDAVTAVERLRAAQASLLGAIVVGADMQLVDGLRLGAERWREASIAQPSPERIDLRQSTGSGE